MSDDNTRDGREDKWRLRTVKFRRRMVERRFRETLNKTIDLDDWAKGAQDSKDLSNLLKLDGDAASGAFDVKTWLTLQRQYFSRPVGARDVKKAAFALDVLAAIIPTRIANEEIGDALEAISRLRASKRPRWLIFTKVTFTFVWVSTHALADCVGRALGFVKAAAGLGGGKGDPKK